MNLTVGKWYQPHIEDYIQQYRKSTKKEALLDMAEIVKHVALVQSTVKKTIKIYHL
jgi:hypothetical protein